MIYETHAHYDDDAYSEDIEEVLKANEAAGIARIVNVAASMEGCKTSIALADKYPHIYASVGVHPSETMELTSDDMNLIKQYAAHEKVVAIGEIGLDYHDEDVPKEVQQKWFISQLDIAREVNLPLIIHSRDAAADTLNIIKEQKAADMGGVIHCFSYGVEMAREYLNMGFYLGIGGVVTFKNGKKLKEVVEYAPIESLVTETDSPYLAPTPYRGTRNTSANIPIVIEEIARIKEMEIAQVEEILWNNALRMYRQQA